MPLAPGSNCYVGLGDMVTLEHACFALDKLPDSTHQLTPHPLLTSQTTETAYGRESTIYMYQIPTVILVIMPIPHKLNIQFKFLSPLRQNPLFHGKAPIRPSQLKQASRLELLGQEHRKREVLERRP